jgi:DEAD/DEAH box helicase domain-containing protein
VQSQAIKSSISGRHIVVATSTSSGKSLCYNIPVLESLSQDPMACALYIFPTKVWEITYHILAMVNWPSINIDRNSFSFCFPGFSSRSVEDFTRDEECISY